MTAPETWRDPTAAVADRVDDLIGRMTPAEKIGQLASVWMVGAGSGEMAPMQQSGTGASWSEAIADGLGQLTRPFGTSPVEVEQGLAEVARQQAEVRAANRFGIPAQVHEECLTGLNAWGATIYPTPLSWAATFDPDLVEAMARQIGDLMRRLGLHQGLAPVLDVVRDLRWGRVEETLGEDPHLVGTLAAAYVRGLEGAGVVATVKHFLGYSASRGGRNLAPVSMGSRELADVILPPFERALRAGVRSVMNSYTDLDGVPSASDPALLTGLLRDELGFEGTVVSDYFSVAFLHTLHRTAADLDRGGAPRARGGPRRRAPVGRRVRPRSPRRRHRGPGRREAPRPCPGAGAAPEVRARPARPRLVARPGRAGRPRPAGRARAGP